MVVSKKFQETLTLENTPRVNKKIPLYPQCTNLPPCAAPRQGAKSILQYQKRPPAHRWKNHPTRFAPPSTRQFSPIPHLTSQVKHPRWVLFKAGHAFRPRGTTPMCLRNVPPRPERVVRRLLLHKVNLVPRNLCRPFRSTTNWILHRRLRPKKIGQKKSLCKTNAKHQPLLRHVPRLG